MNNIKILTAFITIFFSTAGFSHTVSKDSPEIPVSSYVIDKDELNLSGNNLKSLPAEIFTMENLRVLNLSNNNLTSLPKEIKNLHNLRILNLKGNAIYELPFELKRLKFLKEIYLDYDYWYTKLDEVKKLTNAKIILL